jgi:hypothetical protein
MTPWDFGARMSRASSLDFNRWRRGRVNGESWGVRGWTDAGKFVMMFCCFSLCENPVGQSWVRLGFPGQGLEMDWLKRYVMCMCICYSFGSAVRFVE